MFRLLPWDYGIRNLFRRPVRTLLTLASLTLVVLLVLVVVGFIRGLEAMLAISGEPGVMLVHARAAGENLENSAIAPGKVGEFVADLADIQRRTMPGGTVTACVSPEIFLGTEIAAGGDVALGLVRGVTTNVLLVRRRVQLVDGKWPGPREVIVGRLAEAKLGMKAGTLTTGSKIALEGREWTIAGRFAAGGSALEAEVWANLDDLQSALKRTDISLAALALAPGASEADVRQYFMERIRLEMEATSERDMYMSLQRHYSPVRALAWVVVFLVAGAGVFAGLNTMIGAVLGRVRELATLEAMGFLRPAIAISLFQESLILSAAASLLASLAAMLLLRGSAVRFTMGAFPLNLDGPVLLIGSGIGLLMGVLGALPGIVRAMRLPLVDALKAI